MTATSLYLKIPLLIGKADELFVGHLRQMMHTPSTVFVHMDGHNQPSQWEAKKGSSFQEQVQEAATQRRRGDKNQILTRCLFSPHPCKIIIKKILPI